MPGFCHHEFIVPTHECSLQFFQSLIGGCLDSIEEAAEFDTVRLSFISRLSWIYVIRTNGEIIVGPEEFGIVKHASLAAGEPVWAAGEVGVRGGRIRLVNLRSGHYVAGRIAGGTDEARALTGFVQDIFLEYCRFFGLSLLDNNFQCVY